MSYLPDERYARRQGNSRLQTHSVMSWKALSESGLGIWQWTRRGAALRARHATLVSRFCSGLTTSAAATLSCTVLILPRAHLTHMTVFLAAVLLISVAALFLSTTVVGLGGFALFGILRMLVHICLLLNDSLA